jgi:putative oxidoreductase
MSWRTAVFEVLAMGALAWLVPGPKVTSSLLSHGSRYLLALSLIVFGVDHFLALAPIGTLIPDWIPWHVFWIAVFGAGFIAAGLSIALNVLQPWGAFGIGLMFATWVITLHLPRVLGLYAIPGAPRNPAEWSSLFIAIALWGGPWALTGMRWRRRIVSKHIDASEKLAAR